MEIEMSTLGNDFMHIGNGAGNVVRNILGKCKNETNIRHVRKIFFINSCNC